MHTEALPLSPAFTRLYCESAVFGSYSAFHPISLGRVLPFRHRMEGVDDPALVAAEERCLAGPNAQSRLAVLAEYCRCGLLGESEVRDLKGVIDFFDADFFDLMGTVYANSGMFRCALRWYRELINVLEHQRPNASSDGESVYASVGYCLYSLGLFPEAIAWSKACIGPRQMAITVSQALLNHTAHSSNGAVAAVESCGPSTRYTIRASGPPQDVQSLAHAKTAIEEFAPFQRVHIDWVVGESPSPDSPPGAYPFKKEVDGSSLLRHRMNLLFATCGQADALVQKGYGLEAKRLLFEAAMMEPQAAMVMERLRALA